MDLTVAGLNFLASSGDAENAWALENASTLTGTAGPRTDLFVDPARRQPILNAPRLLTAPPAGDFQLAAKVQTGFESTYDAGVLLLWAGDGLRAKLCSAS